MRKRMSKTERPMTADERAKHTAAAALSAPHVMASEESYKATTRIMTPEECNKVTGGKTVPVFVTGADVMAGQSGLAGVSRDTSRKEAVAKRPCPVPFKCEAAEQCLGDCERTD